MSQQVFGNGTKGGETLASVRDFVGQEQMIQRLAETFKVLGDPLRLKIIYALARTELCVGDLSGLLGARESNVSQQLRILRAMHLVKYRRDGKLSYYSLDDQHIQRVFLDGLEHVREQLLREENSLRI
jgi:ArsR family transcriptional regulator